MEISYLSLIALVSPACLLVYAGYLILKRSMPLQLGLKAPQVPALIGLVVAMTCLALTLVNKEVYSPLLGFNGLGFSIRLDMILPPWILCTPV